MLSLFGMRIRWISDTEPFHRTLLAPRCSCSWLSSPLPWLFHGESAGVEDETVLHCASSEVVYLRSWVPINQCLFDLEAVFLGNVVQLCIWRSNHFSPNAGYVLFFMWSFQLNGYFDFSVLTLLCRLSSPKMRVVPNEFEVFNLFPISSTSQCLQIYLLTGRHLSPDMILALCF